MVRVAEVARRIFHKTEVGLPKLERTQVVNEGRAFVSEARQASPEAGINRIMFDIWLPHINDFARPQKLGENIHAYHNLRHVGSVLAQEMFLLPYVEKTYAANLSKPLLDNAVFASAAGHDLKRIFDVLGAAPKSLYKRHGKKMAEEVRSGKFYPSLTPLERTVAADAIEFHDVDPRVPEERNPEDDLLAIVDRAEGNRLTFGVGFWPKLGRAVSRLSREHIKNPFLVQQNYVSHYFPDLAEKIQPLSKAMLYLSLEGVRQGLSQQEAVWYAVQQLGMEKSQQVPSIQSAA